MADDISRGIDRPSPSVAHRNAIERIFKELSQEAAKVNSQKDLPFTADVVHGWRGPQIVIRPKNVVRHSR